MPTVKYTDIVDLENENTLRQLEMKLPLFVDQYFRHLKYRNTSSNTRVEYARDLVRFFQFIKNLEQFQDVDLFHSTDTFLLDRLTREDFDSYKDSLEYHADNENGRRLNNLKSSPETRARKLSSLRSFFHYLHSENLISHNYAEILETPKIPQHNIIILETDEIDRLFAAIRDTSGMDNNALQKHNKVELRDLAIITLFLGTGIRVSELVGIDLRDIDFNMARIYIRRKGGNYDEVYFGSDVERVLRDYIDNCRPLLFSEQDPSPALFLSMKHSRMTPRAIQIMIKNYAEKAGISDAKALSPHKFRKTAGTHVYMQSGGDLLLTANFLGHKNIETTRKHYTKLNEQYKRKASQFTEELVKPQK